MSKGRLKNRRCIVTGAAGGLGVATVRLFLDEGATVVAVDRKRLPLEANQRLMHVCGDAADPKLIEDTVRRHADADVLVTFAAISVGGKLAETSDDTWNEVFRVNVLAAVHWIKQMLPAMQRSRRGSIVTVGSQLALAGGRNNASYLASKGAIFSLTRSVALDYAADNVRCNCIVPGAIDTPLLRRSFARAENASEAEAASLGRHPLGRFGTAEEIAKAAVFLASEEASFTTGALLTVDGGWLAG